MTRERLQCPSRAGAFVRTISLRARLFRSGRMTLVALGTGLSATTFAAVVAGPAIAPWSAALAWVGLAAVAFVTTRIAGARRPPPRGAEAATLIAPLAPSLVSRLRSAVELEDEGVDDGAGAHGYATGLVAAHRAAVDAEVARLDPARVVPWKTLVDGWAVASVILIAASLVCAFTSERFAMGAFALAAAGRKDAGLPIANVIRALRVHVELPQHLGGDVRDDRDHGSDVHVPEGATVIVEAESRVPLEHAELGVGSLRFPAFAARGATRWTARFVATQSAPVRMIVTASSGGTLADVHTIALHVKRDSPPEVRLIAPTSDVQTELDVPVELTFRAQDDTGLAQVALVIQGADGRETRRTAFQNHQSFPVLTETGRATLVPSSVGARRGDTLVVWLEATDTNTATGPRTGRSATRRVTIPSDDARHRRVLQDLDALLERAIATLANHLEADADRGDGRPPSAAKSAELARQASMLADGLRSLVQLARHDRMTRSADVAIVETLAEELTQAASAPGVETRTSGVLEDVTLALDAIAARAAVADVLTAAQALTRNVDMMTKWTREVAEHEGVLLRSELTAERGRAQEQTRRLQRALAALAKKVPDELLTRDATSGDRIAASMQRVADASARRDDARTLTELGTMKSQLEALVRALRETRDDVGRSRAGPRERALAEALRNLSDLEQRERAAAEQSESLEAQLAQRERQNAALSPEALRSLLERATSAGEAAKNVPSRDPDSLEGEALERARARLRDVADALRTGDLAEAERMASSADGELDEVTAELEMEAAMFPGPNNRTADAARTAADAQRRARSLQEAIRGARPRTQATLSPQEQAAAREARGRERAQRTAARELGGRFARGPGGVPLDLEAQGDLERAAEAMSGAESALLGSDPGEAARSQRRALRRIVELRERLERGDGDGSSSGEGEDEGSGGDGDGAQGSGQRGAADEGGRGRETGGTLDDAPVRIPGADEFRTPTERRRRVLDGMRETAPAGYEQAVRHYFEQVLR